MIDLDSNSLNFIKKTINDILPDAKIIAFGSRINGKAKQFSDLDIAIDSGEKVDWHNLEKMKDKFAESTLRIMVDIHDYSSLNASFRKIVDQHKFIL